MGSLHSNIHKSIERGWRINSYWQMASSMNANPPVITKDLIAQHDLTDHELTEEQEAGVLASLAELDAGAGITLADAIETIKRGLGRS